MEKGLFIALEGIDYAGKDTQVLNVISWLRELGYIAKFSNEPNDNEFGGSPIGKTIRKMLRGELNKPNDLLEFQRMYVIDRGQDIFSFIKPVVDSGDIYAIVRYAHSTIAYGMLKTGSPDKLIQLHEDVLGPSMVWPDITILIDISGEEAARRLVAAKNKPEFFEQKKDGLEEIRQNYLTLLRHPKFKDSIVKVDGERPVEEVFEDIKKIILPRLSTPKLRFSQ